MVEVWDERERLILLSQEFIRGFVCCGCIRQSVRDWSPHQFHMNFVSIFAWILHEFCMNFAWILQILHDFSIRFGISFFNSASRLGYSILRFEEEIGLNRNSLWGSDHQLVCPTAGLSDRWNPPGFERTDGGGGWGFEIRGGAWFPLKSGLNKRVCLSWLLPTDSLRGSVYPPVCPTGCNKEDSFMKFQCY